MIYAGIDGGGTRTRLALVRGDGMLVGFAEGGSYSFMDHGVESARATLRALWESAWRSAGTEPHPADALFMGTGSVLSDADARTNCGLAIGLGLAAVDRVRADNDAWNAHAGGLSGRPGILLIAGTGSACLGRDAEGRTWRAGGWGYLLHDAGSAHAFGQAAMVAATRDADGRGPATGLTALVCGALGLADMKDIFRRVHHEGVSRAEVAALAPHVVILAEAGDQVACAILSEGADALVEMIATVATHLQLSSPELAVTGGLITNALTFRRLFLERVERAVPGIALANDGLSPVLGAVLLAAAHALGRLPSSFLDTLRASSAHLAASR